MSRAPALLVAALILLSGVVVFGLTIPGAPGTDPAQATPASTPPPAVSWQASEVCSSDAQPGLLLLIVSHCPAGTGYAAPPGTMYNATGGTTGVPVWMSGSNNSSGEVVVVSNSVLTQPSLAPITNFPAMWAYLPSQGWVNLTAASLIGTAPGTLGYDLRISGGCMAWDPAEHYFLAVAGQDTASGNGWTFSYAPGSSPLPGGTWRNTTYEMTGWAMTSCAMAWNPAQQEMVLTGPALGGTGSLFAYWSGAGAWAEFASTSYPTQPPCAFNATMAYDPIAQEVVWFGGSTAGCSVHPSPVLSYTWAWTGATTWTNLTSGLTVAPAGREWATFATTAFGAVLLGGDTSPSTPPSGVLNDTWLFHGQWVQVSLSIDSGSGTFCPRYAASDGSLNSTSFLLFGGATTGTGSCSPTPFAGGLYALNDTWSVQGIALPPSNSQENQTGLPCTDALLSWTNPTAPYGLSIVNDTVYVSDSSGTVIQTIGTNGPSGSVVATGLTCGASYTFRVRAWFSDGAPSPLSAALSFLAGSLPGTTSPGPTNGGGTDLPLIAVVVVAAVAIVAIAGVASRRRRTGGRER